MSKTVEFVPLNGSSGSYQSVPLSDNVEPTNDSSDIVAKFPSRRVAIIGGVTFVLLALLSVLVTFTTNPTNSKSTNPTLKESTQEINFCKTSCANSCAEYKV
jgi:hypothetical protein